jgi:hypothetical protein
MNTFTRIKYRTLIGLAQLLESRGYHAYNTAPEQSYSDLRVSIMCILENNPGMRCYEIENALGLNTAKQRVTNSILRDLEEDGLVMAVDRRWDPVTGSIKPKPREYYLDM